jgi:hypothetical protein
LTMVLMKELNIPISVRFVAKLLKDGISYDTRRVGARLVSKGSYVRIRSDNYNSDRIIGYWDL